MTEHTRPDLSAFHGTKKMPWPERRALIEQQFPSAIRLDWKRAFDSDIDLMGRLIRDVLKLEQAVPSRPGPRPLLDVKAAEDRLRQFRGDDFTALEFPESFRLLSRGYSLRQLERKSGLTKSHIQRLLNGDQEPDVRALTALAGAFKKNPSYFLEYRLWYISGFLVAAMSTVPESTIGLYRKIVTAEKARRRADLEQM